MYFFTVYQNHYNIVTVIFHFCEYCPYSPKKSCQNN